MLEKKLKIKDQIFIFIYTENLTDTGQSLKSKSRWYVTQKTLDVLYVRQWKGDKEIKNIAATP